MTTSLDFSIPKPLTGKEVSFMIEEIYFKVPIILGCYLVESNIVLTLAGLKPSTEFFITVPTDENLKEVKEGLLLLNNLLEQKGIKFNLVGVPFQKPTEKKERIQMVSVDNLLGFEIISKTTKIPGYTIFKQSNGFEGFKQWNNKRLSGLCKAQADGKIEASYDIADIAAGVDKGYPDIAILDFADWLANGRERKLHDSGILHTSTYKEAVPNYLFYPEHASHASIKKNINQAGELLEDFYQSPFHGKISSNKDFLLAREES